MNQITCLIPCLNEEKTIAGCVEEAIHYLKKSNLNGEVLVADNGSKDQSIKLAIKAGARVIEVQDKGYGSALLGGIAAANSEFILMADADQTYEWKDLSTFFELLDQGFDLVMGNRFSGEIEKNAMPFLNKYIGNPILSLIGKIFFKTKIGDFHCGLRGFRKSKMEQINLTASGMEFASEIVIKSSLASLRITEVPTRLRVPPFDRKPHLRPFRDGWRHLRLMFAYAPKFTLALPSFISLTFGLLVFSIVYFLEGNLFGIELKEHSLLVSSAFIFIGLQGLFSWFLAEYSLFNNKVKNSLSNFFTFIQKSRTLEILLLAGLIFFLLGLYLNINAFNYWQSLGYGDLATFELLTKIGPGFIFMIFGLQIIFSSFMLETIKTSQRK
jgi:glycosyltransferase involved in cell wall biosynthesis